MQFDIQAVISRSITGSLTSFEGLSLRESQYKLCKLTTEWRLAFIIYNGFIFEYFSIFMQVAII